MDHAARDVMKEFKDICLAFGESDEFRCLSPLSLFRYISYICTYSFLFRKSAALYNRRQAKILSTVTSLFTSSYVYNWPKYLPNKELRYPPSFDGRIVMYPSPKEVRDYFAWRQADSEEQCNRPCHALLTDTQPQAHINNLYNTIFWALVLHGGESTTQAHATLKVGLLSQWSVQ